jgi:hypothetical protein
MSSHSNKERKDSKVKRAERKFKSVTKQPPKREPDDLLVTGDFDVPEHHIVIDPATIAELSYVEAV